MTRTAAAALAVLLACSLAGCQCLHQIEQWKCDTFGCCAFGMRPSYCGNPCGPPMGACQPCQPCQPCGPCQPGAGGYGAMGAPVYSAPPGAVGGLGAPTYSAPPGPPPSESFPGAVPAY